MRAGYDDGYTPIMKTAVSIPDRVFRKADALAKSLEMSRSELYTKAVSSFVDEHETDGITERLNEVYGAEKAVIDPVLLKMQFISVPQERW